MLVAGGFGLRHGLAFASLLGGFDLEELDFLVTLLGFTVGIELAPLIVVGLVTDSDETSRANPRRSVWTRTKQ